MGFLFIKKDKIVPSRRLYLLRKMSQMILFALMVLTMVSCASTGDDVENTSNKPTATEFTPKTESQMEASEAAGTETISAQEEVIKTEAAGTKMDDVDMREDTSPLAEPETVFDGMTITALNVGQGLSILINADDHLMLYDGGGRESSSYVVSYLKQHGYENFDYMVVSHYDEDHIAGLIGCLHNFSFEQVLCPDYEAKTDIYKSFIKGLDVNGTETIHPMQGDEYQLGNAVVSVLGPVEYGNAKDNNNSIVIRVVYGDYSCIITGDAEIEEENAILASGVELQSDLYVVGHHGSANSSSEAFLAAIAPKAALISCGEYNDYGHPTQETLTALEKIGADIYRTDKQAEIICKSDAENVEYNVAPCEDYSSGAEPLKVIDLSKDYDTSSDQATEVTRGNTNDSNSATYILNTNTHKFHYPDCKSVKQMKAKNKKEVEATREDIISSGYDPCGNCHP